MPGEIPPEVRRLAEEREGARRDRDFVRADALRDRIRAAGFEVTDRAGGFVLTPRPGGGAKPDEAHPLDPRQVPSRLDRPPAHAFSVQWLTGRWPEDVRRGVASFRAHQGSHRAHHLVLDDTGLAEGWPRDVEVIPLRPGTGWAAARNAGLRRSDGEIVVVVDGSVEAEGDVLGPLAEALGDRSVGLAGPFGLVTGDLREFRPSGGPDVDAVEGYVMAFRRQDVAGGLAFHERFRFYRMADVDLSLQVRERGLRVVVVPVPVLRHEHREWAALAGQERDRLSRRNFYRFLDRWRGRTDLLVGS